MAPNDLWPSWKVINLYIFGKPSHTTTVPSFKFLWPIVSEKSTMLTFLGPFPNDYCPLWPLTFAWKVINIYIFRKPTSHTTTVPSFKFLGSIVSEKRAMLTFLGVFPNDYCPSWPLTFARGYQTENIRKAIIPYYLPGKFQVSVFNSVWEKGNVKVSGPFWH